MCGILSVCPLLQGGSRTAFMLFGHEKVFTASIPMEKNPNQQKQNNNNKEEEAGSQLPSHTGLHSGLHIIELISN